VSGAKSAARVLPNGTVTFLFTDVEGSTRLIQRLGDGHRPVMERQAALLRRALAQGVEAGERGDGLFYVFTAAPAALRAAAQAQRLLAAESWPAGAALRVRIGLHSGEGLLGGDSYLGLDVNRAARIAAAAHGGQVLVSAACAGLAGPGFGPELGLRELGRHRLKDLNEPELLFQLTGPGLDRDFPPPRALGSAPVHLPVPLTAFIGRRRELSGVLEQLSGSRLLTLTGPGGAGKTRLALRAAAEAAASFPDGVHFVPLEGLRDPGLLAPAVAAALRLPPAQGDPGEGLREYLRSRRLLLVLDNFEQLLEAGAQAAEWLREAPGLHLLVTSRAPLRLYGEREFAVPPLGLPPAGQGSPGQPPSAAARPEASIESSEAVALFVARAEAVSPGFRLTAENAAAVADIVRRLDGLPLALELAAARVRLFPPAALLARLGSSLAFLTGGPRDLPERQQTLRAAILWSYDLLGPPARSLFRRLSVFAGGARLEQIEAVCGPDLGAETLGALEELCDHSLVRRAPGEAEPRFLMLEIVRELARELAAESGEGQALAWRHIAVYLQLAEQAGPRLTLAGRRAWLDLLEEEAGNFRAALGAAAAGGQSDAALRLVAALWRFWQMRGHIREGRRQAEQALALAGGTEAERIGALLAAGGMAYWQADLGPAESAFEEALQRARRLGDRRLLAQALYNAAFPHGFRREARQAHQLLAEALDAARELGDAALEGELLWGTGTVEWFRGQKASAEPWYDRALERLAGTDAAFIQGWSYRMRGVARLGRGALEEARADLDRALSMFAADRDVSGIVLLLRDFAELALAAGDAERTLRLAGAAAGLETASQTGMLEIVENRIAGLAAVTASLGRERAEALLAEGRLMPLEQAIAFASHPSPRSF
jgi:predicted ATPase/class 3 adenylate cyclase